MQYCVVVGLLKYSNTILVNICIYVEVGGDINIDYLPHIVVELM